MVYLLITLQVAHLPQILESTVRYLFKNEKDKEENGGQKKKKPKLLFQNTLRPHGQICLCCIPT